MGEGQGVARVQPGTHRRQTGIQVMAEQTVQQGQCIGVAVQLRQHLDPGHGPTAGHLQGTGLFVGIDRLGGFEIADHRKRQGLVIQGKSAQALGFGDGVKGGKGGGHVARSQARPGGHQAIDQRADAAIFGHAGQDGGVIFGFEFMGGQDGAGDLAFDAVLFHPFGHGHGAGQVPGRELRQGGPLKQLRILRIIPKGAYVVIDGRIEIAGHARLPRGQVIA